MVEVCFFLMFLFSYSCPIFFSLLFSSTLHSPPPAFTRLSLQSWVIHVSSLASPFPILFLTFPCLFYTYHSLLIPCTLSLILPLQVISISVILFLFWLFPIVFGFLGSVLDSCEFILLFIFLILFFFLDKSL